MKISFSVLLLITMLFSGAYWYTNVEAVCDVPLSYRVGHIDNRFDITRDGARMAISSAESVWEQATGRNLFTYDVDADLVINFVFDERQEFADAETDFRDRLDDTEGANTEISETYATLVSRYTALEMEYKDKATEYEQRLSSYNAKVEQYNEEGGAPEGVYKKLQVEQDKLDSEVKTVNSLGEQLNKLGAEINNISEKGNQLIETYNQNVETYNETFGDSREFTQGDYQGEQINIYKFIDTSELELVLAHELGHSLSLDHVIDQTAIMYHHLGEQPKKLSLTQSDLDEYMRVCGDSTKSWTERLFIKFGI